MRIKWMRFRLYVSLQARSKAPIICADTTHAEDAAHQSRKYLAICTSLRLNSHFS
jgi:hypothetical protein